jgi:hypothetical protein
MTLPQVKVKEVKEKLHFRESERQKTQEFNKEMMGTLKSTEDG